MRQPAHALFVIIAATTALHANAATQPCGSNASSTISTDRPQITSASTVVPCGSLQLENGLTETSTSSQRTFDLPETSIRFGVANRTELRLAVPIYYSNFVASSGTANGFGDLTLGLKQQLGPIHKFDLSIIPAITLPTGAELISSHGYDPSIQAPWSRSLSKNWTAAGMLSIAWPTIDSRHNATGQASVFFDRQLTAPWDAWVEYSGSFPQRGGATHILDFGTAWKLTPHQQLDFHCGFGLSAAAPDHFLGIGYSVRFQPIHAR
jgi:Putative MetA-pathway of phenol degradation